VAIKNQSNFDHQNNQPTRRKTIVIRIAHATIELTQSF